MQEKSESEIISENLILAFVRFKRMFANRHSSQFNLDQTRYGLKNSEIMLLFRLKHFEEKYPDGISVSELSDNMNIKPPSVTSVITVLEQKEMIRRCMDLNDRRRIRIQLTEAGNQFIEDNQKRFFHRVKGLVEYLGPEKSKIFAELINETYNYYNDNITEQSATPKR